MANQDIVNYIVSQEQKGVSPTDVRKALVDAGWQATDVDEAFTATSSMGAGVSAVQPSPAAATPQDMYAGLDQTSQSGGLGQPMGVNQPPMGEPLVQSPLQQPAMTMPGMNPTDNSQLNPMMQPGLNPDPMGGLGQLPTENTGMKKWLIIAGIVVGALVLIGGGYYLYKFYTANNTTNTTNQAAPTNTAPQNQPTTNSVTRPPVTNTNTAPVTNPVNTNTTPVVNTTPTPPVTNTNTVPPVNTTNTNVGTVTIPNQNTTPIPPTNTNTGPDLTKVDSDGDGLSDQEEITYSTNPKKADTDGDGFRDGDEVKNGYNPNGDGKL